MCFPCVADRHLLLCRLLGCGVALYVYMAVFQSFFNALLVFDIILVVIGNQVELFDLTRQNQDMVGQCEAYNDILNTTYLNTSDPTQYVQNCGSELATSADIGFKIISVIEIVIFLIFLGEHALMIAAYQKVCVHIPSHAHVLPLYTHHMGSPECNERVCVCLTSAVGCVRSNVFAFV
jgi:hypothetical protein